MDTLMKLESTLDTRRACTNTHSERGRERGREILVGDHSSLQETIDYDLGRRQTKVEIENG